MNLLYLGIWLSTATQLVTAQALSTACRCRLNELCWPSEEGWKSLNDSVNGNLVRVRPVGDVCHGSAFDTESCKEAIARTSDPEWRLSQPGALMWTNWETLPEENEDCYLDTPRSRPCKQGRISPYAVLAQTVGDIQKSLSFAKARNIHVVVRNTGHDMTGRSSGPSSLQINLSKFKGINYTDHFVPRGGHKSLGKAATLEAATLGSEFSKDAVKNGYVPLVGLCSSVGMAGGYLQGGGLSSLAAIYGLATEHALEFEVVTAAGDLVVANEFQNRDVFWALRGGGGGTFGVAVRSTVRVFDDFPALYHVTQITVPDSYKNGSAKGSHTLWDVATHMLRLIPTIHDGKTSGNLGITRMSGNNALVTMELVFTDTHNATAADNKLAELYSALQERGIPYNLTRNFLQSYSYMKRPVQSVGWGDYDASVLLSRQFLTSTEAPSRMVSILSQINLGVGDSFEIDLIAGRAMHKDPVGTALHPSWKNSIALLTLHKNLSPSPTPEMQFQAQFELTNSVMPLFRSIDTIHRQMGSYSNTADPNEPFFQQAFWGENYERLSQIKRVWDKDEMFIARTTVGSEGWDSEGLCRVTKG